MEKIYCCECDLEITKEDISKKCGDCSEPICKKCYHGQDFCDCCKTELHD